MSLVRINKKLPGGDQENSGKRPYKTGLSPLHCFFLIGGLIGFLGTTWLGVHLWMMLHGQIPIPESFHEQRYIHAVIQLYGFLGLFIAGFLLQATPRAFQLQSAPAWVSIAALFCTLAGITILPLEPYNSLSPALFFITWMVVVVFLAGLLARSNSAIVMRTGVALFAGSCSFLLGLLLDLGKPLDSLIIFWCGAIPIILATSQQFIAAFLGGRTLNTRDAPIFVSIMLLSFIAILLYRFAIAAEPVWLAFCISAFCVFIFFFYATGLLRAVWTRLRDPLGLAYACVIVWSLLGAGALFKGPHSADFPLHIWGTGIAVTLIIAVSSRILGFLAGLDIAGDRKVLAALIIWQIVPIGRSGILPLPLWFSWAVGLATAISLIMWLVIMISRAAKTARAAGAQVR